VTTRSRRRPQSAGRLARWSAALHDDSVSLGEGGSVGAPAPSPYVGAGVIAAGLVVLVVGVVYLNRSDEPPRLAMPTSDGVTLPTDSDGRTVDVPPSQPAGVVHLGADGSVLRPDPVRARIVDRETGIEILITLPPNTTIDAITGEVIPRPPGTSGPTTVTTGPTTTSGPGTTGGPGTTEAPTTTEEPTTTEATTTTTEPTTTTEEPTTTTEATTTTEVPPTDPPIP
jgi:hypothetical protein